VNGWGMFILGAMSVVNLAVLAVALRMARQTVETIRDGGET
jgi:hypothetical protein